MFVNSFTIIFGSNFGKNKILKMKKIVILIIILFASLHSFGQANLFQNKEYNNLEEALKNPELVYKLNLSNQNLKLNEVDWSKFVNMEYLNLKNDHLKEIPAGISTLKSLKKIDLSGNDFNKLPIEFSNLTQLEEVILNDEKNMDLPKTLNLLAKLPNLKSLHLENDRLKVLPQEILEFKNLENLYLNENKLKTIPKLDALNHLKYLDLKGNEINFETENLRNSNFGFQINF